MISSPEDARLLLNKWMRESARLVAFVSTVPTPPADFAVRLEGCVTRVEEGPDMVVLFESGEDFIMFRLSEVIEYSESIEHSANLAQVLARERQKWVAALCLTYAHSTLLFCTNESATHI
jgi:hypothetical protein